MAEPEGLRGLRGLTVLGPERLAIAGVLLAFSAFWLWAAIFFGVLPVGTTPYNRLGGVAGSDFMFFYPAAVLARDGRAREAYDPAILTNTARSVLGERVPELVWPYPPSASMPLALLGGLGPRPALLVWVAVAIVSLVAAARLSLGGWRFALVVLLCPAAGLALFTGQVSPTVGLLMAVLARRSTPPVSAGVALGLLTLKPHFGIFPLFAALTARHFKAMLVATGVAAGLAGTSLLLFGAATWETFLRAGLAHSRALPTEAPLSRFVSVLAAGLTLGADWRIAILFQAIVTVVSIALAVRLWRRASCASARVLGYAAGVLLATPYVLDYDLVLLALPWVLMIDESFDRPSVARRHFWIWVALTLLAPVTYLFSLYSGRSIGGVLVFAVLLAGAWVYRAAPNVTVR